MATTMIDGRQVSYEVFGEGRPIIITPGGRFSKDTPGIRPLAEELAAAGYTAIIWDRPNTGASDVNFTGENESETQAEALVGLLRALDVGPTILMGGSGGARVSLLAAAHHPDVAAGLIMLNITGGVHGLLGLAQVYGAGSFGAAWEGGMEAVAALPEWAEVQAKNPRNTELILSQDRAVFLATMERWMQVYCPVAGSIVPGITDAELGKLELPVMVFRSGASDPHHRRDTSEAAAAAIPGAALVEPPWGDTEWVDRVAEAMAGSGDGLFKNWPQLAPQLVEFARSI